MSNFNKKRNYKKLTHSPVFLLLLIFILLVLIKALWGVYQKESISAQNLKQQQDELGKIALRNKDLTQSIDNLKTDKGIESEIRNKFRVVKEGESLAVIIDSDEATTTPLQASTTPSFWQRLLNMIY